MKSIPIEIERQPDPTEKGKYLFYSPMFGLTVVNVIYIPPRVMGGIELRGYLGVVEWGWRGVSHHSKDTYFIGKVVENIKQPTI